MRMVIILLLVWLHASVGSAQQTGGPAPRQEPVVPRPGEVEGVGGVFVFSNDPQRLANWYREHLGIPLQGSAEHGYFYHAFQAVASDTPSRRLDTNFSVMRATVDLPKPEIAEEAHMYGDQPYMVNFQVGDLDATLAFLAAKGIEPIKREEYPYGRFAWVRDGDGNRIELYEPNPDAYQDAAKSNSPLRHLRWLAGTWQRETAKSISIETWRWLSDRTLEGEGIRLSKASGDTAFTESLRIVEMQGETFYLAKVAENPYPVPFKLTSFESGHAVFENPEHDFPQRLTYVHNATDSLTVLVEGERKGRRRGIRFRFAKKK